MSGMEETVSCTSREPKVGHSWGWNLQGTCTAAACRKCDCTRVVGSAAMDDSEEIIRAEIREIKTISYSQRTSDDKKRLNDLEAEIRLRHPERQQVAAPKPNVIEPFMRPFGLLWKSIMLEDSLVVDTNCWSLSSSKVFWAESTNLLIIRELWVTYRDLILSTLSGSHQHCVKLSGKSGRGTSIFLKYLIFFILLEAKKLCNHSQTTPFTAEHLTDPMIAFMDCDNVLYHITKENITVFGNRWELVAAVGTPHFYFSDNVDVDDAGAGSLVTMAISSGDANILKEFSKRMDEARTKARSVLVMSGLNLNEMLQVFPDLSTEEVTFRFDVVGGNPRLAFARLLADKTSAHYTHVWEVVERMFSAKEERQKQWAVSVVCCVLDEATKNKASDALDSSTFRDFVVWGVEDGVAQGGEVFASKFMGLVASRIYHSTCDETIKAVLLKLCGSWAGSAL